MNSRVHSPHRPGWARGVCSLMAVALLIVAAGCYGTFPLTKAVYSFNGEVTENELGQSLLFWGFLILPVYELATLGDAIIFNLIEFWSGESLDVG